LTGANPTLEGTTMNKRSDTSSLAAMAICMLVMIVLFADQMLTYGV
jgi:hypothetical protein